MRDAELKHARLAMLAAAGWPLSELASGALLRAAGTNGRAPSVFNGGLGDFPLVAVIFAAFAWIELQAKYVYQVGDGDFGFDPLGFAQSDGLVGSSIAAHLPHVGDMGDMRVAEIKNGRLAMLAITGFAVQEYVTGVPVVDQSPWFFGR
jgi:light-harvesting complex II chlorophyll a/b binding protein 4